MRSRPLSGKTVLVTRPRGQSAELAGRLRALGARVVAAPTIRVAPPTSWRALDEAIRDLGSYDAVVFTSVNGVESFFARARGLGLRRRLRRPKRLYAIGPRTARALRDRGWGGVAVPGSYEGAALAGRLGAVRGLRILIPRAKVAREVLPRLLRARGAKVTVVEAYRTTADAAGLRRLRRAAAGGVDFVTFTSSSTVENFFKALGRPAARAALRRARAASIGPVTSATLRRLGAPPSLEASEYTVPGLAKAIAAFASRGR